MSSTITRRKPTKRASALRATCEKSARSVVIAIRRATPDNAASPTVTELVTSMAGVIEETAQLLIAGKQVRVVEDEDAITTQEAADLLNVSRPHVVKLLDSGQIPQLPKAGRHRRVSRAAVLKYKRAQDNKRASALKQLTAVSQRHNLGY